MSFLLATFRKDIARWRQDHMAILIWIGLPFMIGGLITAMVDQDSDGGPMGTVLIADLDDTLLSGLVAAAFGQDEMANLLGVQQVTSEEGTALIEAGEASGFLTIPEGFQDAFINNTPLTLHLKTNPSQTILPGIIEDITEILLDAGFYVQGVFGDEISQLNGADVPDTLADAFVSDMAVQIQHKIEKLESKIFPPVIEVEVVEPPSEEPRPDIALLFLPGIVLMALMFSAQGLSADYWKERDCGALRRLVSTHGLLSPFVLGKALAAAVMMGIIGGATLLVGFIYHGILWDKMLPAMLWIVVSGVGLFAWFAALQMLLTSSKAANLLTSLVVFPLLMMGGSFFPLDVLPDWMAAIGRLSPNGFVADKLTIELTSATAWTFEPRSWFTAIAIALSGLAISTWRLRTGFARK
jgi:ABC-type transport system involved in cytochrome c biogenesis permease component